MFDYQRVYITILVGICIFSVIFLRIAIANWGDKQMNDARGQGHHGVESGMAGQTLLMGDGR